MNKPFKTTILALCLFATHAQMVQCSSGNNSLSYWQIVVNSFSCDSQPQSQSQDNPEQAPAGVTVQDYINQFRCDLNGPENQNRNPIIPWSEVEEMEAAIRKELHSTANIRDTEIVNNKIRSIVVNHVKTKTFSDLQELLRVREGYNVTNQDCRIISESNESNMIARLGQMPHLNGEAIAQYFGAARKNSLRNILINKRYN